MAKSFLNILFGLFGRKEPKFLEKTGPLIVGWLSEPFNVVRFPQRAGQLGYCVVQARCWGGGSGVSFQLAAIY